MNSKKNHIKYIVYILIACTFNLGVSQRHPSTSDVYVNEEGVMIWEKTGEEVKGFGVNYSVPFAHAYRSAVKMGIDPKEAIDNDVYHFTRLGFDLYRLHVWDTEISDDKGNLIENEHLDTFDYLLKKLKDHNINYVITPIAFWGNGWPEPDTESPGFSHKYGKGECLTNEDAIKAQQNYLYQFLNHVNPYTGVAYKDEPNIIAFEVSNEPHHKGEAKKVTEYVKVMVKAMRKTGTKKPIFYNMSHGVHFADAYFKGNVQGGTFQWYPTGLGYQQELSGNMLPNVSDYNIPFESTFKSYKGAKLVYEFDAADIGRSYIYPAMARSFRTAGIQIATHFAYDPTYLAYANTEYNTHYMNLNYTPQKALSLKICAEVFHEIPMYSKYGVYPKNNTFGNFKVDYKNDLSEYNTAEKFFYTNSTKTIPINVQNLKEIAGYGNSKIVNYNGKGAYFLDKINNGIWRLEVLPDALWVNNPFGRNSLNKTVGVIKWEEHIMSIDLSDLGENFKIEAINSNNNYISKVEGKNFKIKPGVYMLSNKDVMKTWSPNDDFKTNKLNDFYAPESNLDKPWLVHEPTIESSENYPLKVTCQFISSDTPKNIILTGYNSNNEFFNIDMSSEDGYTFFADIPKDKMKYGFIKYNIVVTDSEDKKITYPSGKSGNIYDWDFYDRTPYTTTVVPQNNPIHLFNAIDDTSLLVKQWRRTFKLVPTANQNEAEYQMNFEKLFYPDNENLNAKPIFDYSFKHFILKNIKGRKQDLISKKQIVFKGRALNDKPCKLQIALVLENGSSYGKVIELDTVTKDHKIHIDDLKLVKTVTLPRPYPTFLPYYLNHSIDSEFDLNKIESIQFSIGPDIAQDQLQDSHGIGIISVRIE